MTTQTHDQLLNTIKESLAACGYKGQIGSGELTTLSLIHI